MRSFARRLCLRRSRTKIFLKNNALKGGGLNPYPTKYSHSKLGTFQQCRFKFKLQYVDGVKSDVESIEVFLGKRVHETLEKLYKDLRYQKLNSREELLAFFAVQWDKEMHEQVFVVKKEYAVDNYREMGRKFISDYYDHYKPFNTITTIGLETQDLLPLSNGDQYHIRIDRLSCDKEGNYYVCDYKTNNSLKPQEELDEDKQLAMYSLWVKQKFPDAKNVKLVWYFLAFDKEMISERSQEQLINLKAETEAIIEDIKKCTDFPTQVSSLCDYCQFKSLCPAWMHELELETKTPEAFKDDDGVKPVDEYAKLASIIDDSERKKEKIKFDLIRFAEQKGVEVVWGTHHKTSVKLYESIFYPKTEEFRLLLKQKGIYDKVTTLNNQMLRSFVLRGNIDDDIKQRIRIEEGHIVRLSKRKED